MSLLWDLQPEAGLDLVDDWSGDGGPEGGPSFALELDDEVMEQLIKNALGGEAIELELGESPALLYGGTTFSIGLLDDEFCEYDLYTTKTTKNTASAEKLQFPTMSLWKKPKFFPTQTKSTIRTEKVPVDKPAKFPTKQKPAPAGTSSQSNGARASSTSPSLDSDIEALRTTIALDKDRKSQNVTTVVDSIPKTNKRGKTQLLGKPSYNVGGTPRSLPSSPALNGLASPSLGPTLTSSQQLLDQAKKHRRAIVHELAVREQPFEYMENIWEGLDEDLKPVLNKIADYNETLQKYALKKTYWKELDVWNYEYESQEERQFAIDNAIKQFDRMRLASYQEEWQKLLPMEERGKGKCLSKLQASIANIANGTAPSIKVQKPGSPAADDDDRSGSERGKANKGEPMTRSSSNPLPQKKAAPAAGPVKKLLNNGSAKSAAALPLAAKKAAATPAAKAAAAAKLAKDRPKVLSEERAVDSSSSDDEDAPLSTTVPSKASKHAEKEKPARPAPAAASAPKPKPAPATSSAPRPSPPPPKEVTRDTIRAQVGGTKRPRPSPVDDDDSSSSSGPLSKRLKNKEREKEPSASSTGATITLSRPSGAQKNRAVSDNHIVASGTYKERPGPSARESAPASSTILARDREKDRDRDNRDRDRDRDRENRDRDRERDRERESFKNHTSPAKSSPLASSPTNASEMDNTTDDQHTPPTQHARSISVAASAQAAAQAAAAVNGKKRKVPPTDSLDRERDGGPATVRQKPLNNSSSSSLTKIGPGSASGSDAGSSVGTASTSSRNGRKRPKVPDNLLMLAARFQEFYATYEKLHRELSGQETPDRHRLSDLLDMRERLADMKRRIVSQTEAIERGQ